MKQLKSLLQVMLPDLLKSFAIFWSIMLAILTSGYIIATLVDTTEVFLMIWPIFLVWLSITIFQIVKTDFHYALKMGATRKQFVLASVCLILFLIVLGETIHLVYLNALPFLAEIIGLQSVNLFTWTSLFPEISTGLVISYDLILAFFFGTMLFTLASVKFQFGKLPVFIILGALGILLLIPTVNQALVDYVVGLHGGDNLLSVFLLAIPALFGLLISRQILLQASLR